jgi:GTPase SAR1 family protein
MKKFNPPRPERYIAVRTLVVGAENVGKTSIIRRFHDKDFKPSYEERGIEYKVRYAYFRDNKDFTRIMSIDVPCYKTTLYYNCGY